MTTPQHPIATPEATPRNDGITIACPICQRAVPRVGRRRFCSDACRQAAWRARQPVAPALPIPRRSPRPATIYECPACETRFLGEQYCPDCRTFCRRVGPGGACPHCSEPVAVGDLVDDPGGGHSTP
jgi:endogenous inhibitor of DNA gyrase (YacG/DUF329 family)